MSADTIAAALEYQERGWRVIPLHWMSGGECTCGKIDCGSAGKHPIQREWQNSPILTKPDIYALFDDVTNIGILTGRPSGVLVIDIDPASGGSDSLNRLVMTKGRLPDTLRVRTGGGGMHIYFKMPDFDLGNGRGELKDFPGIDVRGTGGFVVAPPSVSGKGAYAWLER